MFVAGVIAILAALRILGVQDWRCYGVALISAPAINSIALGTLTSFLLLGTALCWRYRDNPAAAGVATAVTALLKLFLWPLGVWLLVTRRWRAAIICTGLILLVGGWAVIDLPAAQLSDDPARPPADRDSGELLAGRASGAEQRNGGRP
jgi:hypothetical protein